MSTDPTAKMLNAYEDAAEQVAGQRVRCYGAGLTAVLAIAEPQIRAAVAAEIQAALTADQADDDTTSGKAIWEQGGYRRGLATAADIARGEP